MVLAGEAAAKKIKYWATQAREKARHYEHREIGYNYRLVQHLRRHRPRADGKRSTPSCRPGAGYTTGTLRLFDLPVSFYPHIDGAGPNCWLTVMTMEAGCGVTDTIIDALGGKTSRRALLETDAHACL